MRAAIRSSAMLLKMSVFWGIQDREMGGMFGRDINLHQPVLKGVERTGVAIHSPKDHPAS